MKVLFIDDNDVAEITKSISRKMSTQAITCKLDFLDISDSSFKVDEPVNGEFVLDFEKIKNELIENYFITDYDVVALDYNYANDELNGYKLLRWLIHESNQLKKPIRKARFVCYSSEEDKFAGQFDNTEDLIKLIKLNMEAFYKREKMVEPLCTLLKKIQDAPVDLSQYMIDEMEKHSSMVFNNVYPKYKGKTFGDIAKEIDMDSHHGIKFKRSIIDFAVAGIVDWNKA